ncbi:hypothetical protein BB560_006952 [Smittium megazygosporum]|uniref:Fork-head domain-containing protein n=1 Tax=Smittium megazygosporum TaxID=133381 RepID=A0A2T9Y021_9FUNG|nr:hypothetical protein BB560_006952 [Smittium megazygosporum]
MINKYSNLAPSNLDIKSRDYMNPSYSSPYRIAPSSQYYKPFGTFPIHYSSPYNVSPFYYRNPNFLSYSNPPSLSGSGHSFPFYMSHSASNLATHGLHDSHKKPEYSYASLIAQAINDSPGKKRTLNEIYEYILEKYPYYRKHEGWQNSIRHNLSLHKGFTKVKRKESAPGKGHLWEITKEYESFFSDGHFKLFKSKSKPGQSCSQPQSKSKTQDQPSPKSEDSAQSPVLSKTESETEKQSAEQTTETQEQPNLTLDKASSSEGQSSPLNSDSVVAPNQDDSSSDVSEKCTDSPLSTGESSFDSSSTLSTELKFISTPTKVNKAPTPQPKTSHSFPFILPSNEKSASFSEPRNSTTIPHKIEPKPAVFSYLPTDVTPIKPRPNINYAHENQLNQHLPWDSNLSCPPKRKFDSAVDQPLYPSYPQEYSMSNFKPAKKLRKDPLSVPYSLNFNQFPLSHDFGQVQRSISMTASSVPMTNSSRLFDIDSNFANPSFPSNNNLLSADLNASTVAGNNSLSQDTMQQSFYSENTQPQLDTYLQMNSFDQPGLKDCKPSNDSQFGGLPSAELLDFFNSSQTNESISLDGGLVLFNSCNSQQHDLTQISSVVSPQSNASSELVPDLGSVNIFSTGGSFDFSSFESQQTFSFSASDDITGYKCPIPECIKDNTCYCALTADLISSGSFSVPQNGSNTIDFSSSIIPGPNPVNLSDIYIFPESTLSLGNPDLQFS